MDDSWFLEYGWGGPLIRLIFLTDWLIGPAALCVVALSAGSRVMGKDGRIARILSIGIGLLSALPLILGLVGFWFQRVMVKKAASAASGEDQEEMLTLGNELAFYPLKYGGVSAALIVLLAAVAFFLAPARSAPKQSSASEGLPPPES